MSIRNNFDVDENYNSDDDDDDLMLFEQAKRMKVIKQNNLSVGMYKDDSVILESNQHDNNANSMDFNKFYGNHQDQLKKEIQTKTQKQPVIQEINQQELSAKRLRAFNAAKYFEKIKLTYLKQIFNKTRELDEITNKSHDEYALFNAQFHMFLSLLDYDLLCKCIEIREKNVFTVDDEEIFVIFKKVFTNEMVERFYDAVVTQDRRLSKTQLLFMFGSFLNCKIKKVNFFDIHNFVDESFYNLNFDKNERRSKKAKKTTKLQDQIKTKIQRHVYQQQLQQKQQFIDLNNFSFDSVSRNITKTDQQIHNDLKQTKKRSQKIQQLKRQFMQQTFMIFSFIQNRWKLFTTIQNHFEQIEVQWFRQNVLNGLPIVTFYSMQYLNVREQYEKLLDLRKMSKVVIKDLSMLFCDNWKKLMSRKKRVGIRPLIGKVNRFCNFTKPYDILQPFDSFQHERTATQMREILVATQLPKYKLQFNLSEHFLTPSRVGKYHILSGDAIPVEVEDGEDGEKVYWKDDLIPVCSRMGWIDFSRIVRDGEQALKRTENRNKKQIQLYRYEQTMPYVLPMDGDNFVLDPEHNSIYVPPNLHLPFGTCIVQQKISYICNRHKYPFAKLVQGFKHTGGMRVLPNEIGCIIYERDKEKILKLYEERQQLLNRNKETRYDQKIQRMWREVLKFVKLVERMGKEVGS